MATIRRGGSGGTTVVLDDVDGRWREDREAVAALMRGGAQVWVLTRADRDGTARVRHTHEPTDVRDHESRIGGSGPASGGTWGVAGGRIRRQDRGPGGAPAPGVGETPGEPGAGGTPGQTGAGGAPYEPAAGGPPATSGDGGSPDGTGGGGCGSPTTGPELSAVLRATGAATGIVVSADRAVRAAAVEAGWDAVTHPTAAVWRTTSPRDAVQVRTDGDLAVRVRGTR